MLSGQNIDCKLVFPITVRENEIQIYVYGHFTLFTKDCGSQQVMLPSIFSLLISKSNLIYPWISLEH